MGWRQGGRREIAGVYKWDGGVSERGGGSELDVRGEMGWSFER